MNLRILLVEDESLIRVIMAESLRDAGFDVLLAETGDQALELLEQLGEFDLLLTDMQMPGDADGNMVACRAKQLHPGLPVIYATGRPETLTNTLGFNDVVVRKPFGPVEILTLVARALADRPTCRKSNIAALDDLVKAGRMEMMVAYR